MRSSAQNGGRHVLQFIAIIAIILSLSACASANWPTPNLPVTASNQIAESQPKNSDNPNSGPVIVIHIPGISGIWFTDRNWAFGLRDAGVNDIRKFEWTGPITLINLIDYDLHQRKANELADLIRETWSEQTPRPRKTHPRNNSVGAVRSTKVGVQLRL